MKLWHNQLTLYRERDLVGPIRLNVPDYDIAMREGGYVHVRRLKIDGWDDERDSSVPCYDKWGDPWVSNEENLGDVGRELRDAGFKLSPYFWEKGGD